MKIVSKFKGNPSIFIPEYYKIVNQKSPFLQYVLMEHLPYLNLNEFTEVHKFSISFLTKIHLSLLIVSALQILRNSGIVHLDLKPSNIIVGKRMIIKLIDFGESYNK
jgi:serine/threonine protein kinase